MIQKKDRIFSLTKKLISFYVVALFVAVWFGYYNFFAFRTGRIEGGIISVIIYYIIYSYFGKLYKAFKVGASQITEIIFSQFLAIGIADAILYIECCLIARCYVNIFPGLLTAALQLAGMALWSVVTKQYFISHITASKTLILYGRDDVAEFIQKVQKKYIQLFDITNVVSSRTSLDELEKRINECDTVMLYEVDYGMRTEIMQYCIQEKKTVYMTPRIADILISGFENNTMVDTPMIRYEYNYYQPQVYRNKRALDLAVSILFLLIMALPMLFIAIVIKLEDGGPVFFKQKRCTKDGEVFEILKFRSMIVDAEKDGVARPAVDGDSRITRVGQFIRRYRLDEVPQFINVLKGDMSLVGPRPERIEHVEEYTRELPEFEYRMRVKGGLTGYAQIYGKYNTSAYDKLKLDLMYIEKQSLLLDLKLLLLTVKIVFVPESTEGFEEEKSKKIGEHVLKLNYLDNNKKNEHAYSDRNGQR